MKKLSIYFIIFLTITASLRGQQTVGPGGDYPTLKDAFDVINAGTITGDITLQIIDNITEYATAELFESGFSGTSDYTSVTIYPTGSGLTIDGDLDGPLLSFTGATNVILDGRLNGAGSTKDLTINNINTGTSASTIQFIESASSNIVRYCIIMGGESNTTGGVIFFSTASSGNGNDNNIIDNNDITGTSTGRPVNMIFSSGVSGSENSGNIISNNNIFDFLRPNSTSSGILLSSNTTTWTISENSFYETAPFVPTLPTTFYAIQINNTSGTGFSLTGNFIGGRATQCGGSAFTKTSTSNNVFYAIYFNVGTAVVSSIQNNTIKNFNWNNSLSGAWTAIHIAGGAVNIGTVTGNTIGETTSNGSITVTVGGTGATVYGINITGVGTVDCQNNTIGSITSSTLSSSNASNIACINKSNSAGIITISNNTIGSTSTNNSIYASSISSGNIQRVTGILSLGTGTITISNNIVAKMTNATTNTATGNAGSINGITSGGGTALITNNTIYDLTIANANNASNQTASIVGLALYGNILVKTITGNRIYNLSNTYGSFTGHVIGIFFIGSTGSNSVTGNFVHSLSVTGASSTTASVSGIRMTSGATTYANNIISLGGNTTTNIYGIYESGAAGNNNNLFFNTVYIGGSQGSGSNNSYALYSALNTNTRDFRNNIFVNARSGGTSNYAAYFVSSGGSLTVDYNDYFVSGTGGILGYYGGAMVALPIVTGQDVNSLAIDPVFAVPGGGAAVDYKIGSELIGIIGTGILTDYEGTTRQAPIMGAFEIPLNKWIGTTSTAWNDPTNWTIRVPVGENINLFFDDAPLNHCLLDADHSFLRITINQPTYRLVTNGFRLTLNGNMTLTNGAQIDASAVGSTVEFAGALAQSIPAGAFLNNQVYNLDVNNAGNVTFNGVLYLLNSLTTTAGLLDATTNSPTMGYGGSVPQTIDASVFLNASVFNLAVANTSTASIVSDFVVDNDLSITSGNLTVNPPFTLIVTGAINNSSGNGGLIIRSDANGNDGKLINNSASVNATVELSLSGGAGASGPSFHYFVPPVVSMTIGSTIANVRTNLGLTSFNGDLVSYLEPSAVLNKNAGWQYFDGYGSTIAFPSLLSTRGYNFYLTAPDKATFTGQLNGTAHSFTLDYTSSNPSPGWNLIGNPYPCNYDLTGISALMGTGDGVDNTAYFNHNGGYTYWNVDLGIGSTGFSPIVAPMQGFFVLATSPGTVNLPVGSKVGGPALPVRSKSLSLIKKIKLVLNNGTAPDETIICLLDNATSGFDGDYDAYKLFGGGTTPSIYSEINSLKYAINCVKGPIESQVIIPIAIVIKTSGTYSIDFTEFDNLSENKVILKHGDVETIISENTSYTFSSLPGTFTNFQLIIGESSTTPEEIPTDIEPLTNDPVKTWYSNDFMYIYSPGNISSDRGNLTIFDIQGKIVYADSELFLSPGATVQVGLDLPAGVYVTRVIINNQTFVSKIVIF